MKYFLIDYENVKIDGVKYLNGADEGDSVIIFYSDSCNNITLDVLSSITSRGIEIEYHKIHSGVKNALDFQLSSYLGYLIGRGQGEEKFCIVSNDKDYDVIIAYWKGLGKIVDRVCVSTTNTSIDASTKASANTPAKPSKPSKVASSDKATLEEITKILSEQESPKEMLKIVNQYKTKQAISNGISKFFRDSKKASAVYKKLKLLLKEKQKS